MSELETKRKRKKKAQSAVLAEPQEENQELAELVQVLDQLEREGKRVDIQVCPKCKSPKVRRIDSTCGDIMGHMGLTPPMYECVKCGWREKLVLKATNKPTTVRDVVIMAEANDAGKQGLKKKAKKDISSFSQVLSVLSLCGGHL
jgi:hypothetical protein